MQYSQGKFANFFTSGLQLVKHDGGHLRVYVRKVNQNHSYFLMSKGKILHVGGRKHILAMYRRYVPLERMLNRYLQA